MGTDVNLSAKLKCDPNLPLFCMSFCYAVYLLPCLMNKVPSVVSSDCAIVEVDRWTVFRRIVHQIAEEYNSYYCVT